MGTSQTLPCNLISICRILLHFSIEFRINPHTSNRIKILLSLTPNQGQYSLLRYHLKRSVQIERYLNREFSLKGPEQSQATSFQPSRGYMSTASVSGARQLRSCGTSGLQGSRSKFRYDQFA